VRAFLTYLAISLLLTPLNSSAQIITNEGTDFSIAFPRTRDGANAIYWLNITSRYSTSGTVQIPGTGFSQSFTVSANGMVRVDIPSAAATLTGSRTISHRAIRVSANDPVVVYSATYFGFRHDASLCLPNRALGQDYRAITYQSEIKTNVLYRSEFVVVATTDTARVELTYTDSVSGGGGPAALDTFTIPPNRVLQIQAARAQDDLSGSRIRSLNGKDFAVYAGNEWSTVVCTPNSDPLLEVLYPTNSWGKSYLAFPTYSVNKEYVKIVADKDTTVIKRNGIVMDTIHAGEFWDDTIQSTRFYEANKPVELAQMMITGQTFCSPNNSQTDPSMTMMSAVEQMYLDSITFFAVDTNALDSHFVNVITRTNDTDKVFLDGVKLNNFTVFPTATNYAYQWNTINPGAHSLYTTGCGFQAYSMGVGRAVSYAYAAGVTLLDLSNQIQFSNYIDGTDTICLGDTVQFNAITRGTPLSVKWDLGDGTTDTAANPIHSYATTGSYRIEAIIEYECLTDTLVDTVNVPPPPVIDLGPDTAICNLDTLGLTVNTPTFNVRWSTGSKLKWIKISQPDTYNVLVFNYCGSDRDTVVIDSLYPDTVNLGPDTLICLGDSLYYNLTTLNNTSYLWSDGDTGAIKVLDSTGLYWAELSNVCGVRRDSIDLVVERPPVVDFGADTAFCHGTIIFLNAINSRSTYLWQDGSRLGGHNVLSPGGLYWVQVTNPCGLARDSIFVDYDFPLSPSLGPDTVLCNGDSLNWQVGLGTASILWENGSTDSSRSVTNPGSYWMELTNLCGTYGDTIEVDAENTPLVNLPNDTIFCIGNALTASVSYSRSTYLWSNGDTDSSSTFSTAGKHWVQATNICGVGSDTLELVIDEPIVLNFPDEAELCDTDTLLLDARINTNGIHFWNTGDWADTVVVRSPGVYAVRIENTCGHFGDTILVNYEYTPQLEIFGDTTLCEGVRMRIQTPAYSNANFQWSDGSQFDVFEISQKGDYWLRVENRCGFDIDSFGVQYQKPPVPYLGGDQVLCPNEILLLDAFDGKDWTYRWHDGSIHSSLEVDFPGTYSVEVWDAYGCYGIDSVVVAECKQTFYIPSAFSPNKDGHNELFRVYGERLDQLEVSIYNRWGEKIYSANGSNFGWDGKYRGEDCPVGVYSYEVQFPDLQNQLQIEVGKFSLVR
jgi:gliding motility-associated-like protein